ncbi:hypothetical protein LRY65_03120 [Candidatus Woesebacteria bacterium]|nr:hypothetical protein [Candidatus Woesebacteria bacterium]MCD8507352.1 hypothetical protein [Candidatus Woesebacteria bacterium]MCD8527179.1 hypothetical protein [Candidatus Woesebacteria bacterium]MCD8546785.1 hypothetical protein [Candidatus Woesebacteria bacterium]
MRKGKVYTYDPLRGVQRLEGLPPPEDVDFEISTNGNEWLVFDRKTSVRTSFSRRGFTFESQVRSLALLLPKKEYIALIT